MNCPFCPPLAELTTFAETPCFRALYNIAPVLPGHSLVVPKEHIRSMLGLNENLLYEMVVFSRKIVQVLMKAFSCQSFDWTIQDGTEAGQTIEHLHLHIIPRHSNDLAAPGDWYPAMLQNETAIIDSALRQKINQAEMVKIVSFLKETYIKL
ncbi:MAG: HIT family protein [Bacteroidales bacterium]|nr:HIT family protein [Bacteroidales bacterium]